MTKIEESWLALRNAIIEQAAIDYKLGFSLPEDFLEFSNDPRNRGLKPSHQKLRDDAAKFFKSKWCNALLGMDNSDMTGEGILRRLKEYTLEELKDGQKESKMQVELIQQTPKPIDTIVKIASICYDSRPTNKMAMVKHLYLNGHHSTFEHVYFTFKISGISRACSHQLVRHRLAAFTQRSQRYCEENGFEYVEPDSIKNDKTLDTEYKTMMRYINETYCDWIHLKDVKKEDARFVLPNACETELYMSCNLRELIHIANERLCARAQWEIRELVSKMVALVDPEIRWMLVPKCESGYSICNYVCAGHKGYTLMRKGEKEE